jgi:hypothetical protein
VWRRISIYIHTYIHTYIIHIYSSSRCIKHESVRSAIRLATPIHYACLLRSMQFCTFPKVWRSCPLRWGTKCIPFESTTALIPSPCVLTLYSLVIVYAQPGLKFRHLHVLTRQRIYVFCTVFRKKKTGLHKRDGVRLLGGTNWIYKYISG